MSEFTFVLLVFVIGLLGMSLWMLIKELFRRWFSNDWCRHDWGAWENRRDEWTQYRYCTKCNQMERRIP